MLYSRNEHNIVNQPCLNKNLKSSVKLKTQNSNTKKKDKRLDQEKEKRRELPISEMRMLTPLQILQATWKSG